MIIFERKLVYDLQPHPLLGTSGMLDGLIENEVAKSTKGDAAQKKLRQARAEELELKLDSLKADIATNGIQEPLKICTQDGEWFIVDGRHRWHAALALELKHVPCVVVKADAAKEIILSAMLGKHLSKGARAYSAVQVHPEVALEAKVGRKKNSVLNTELNSEPSVLNTEGLAQKIGVSLSLVEKACALYRAFQDHKVLKVKYEQSVWTCGSIAKLLGEVKAAVERYERTGSYELPKETAEKKEDRIERTAKAKAMNYIKDSSDRALELNKGWQLFGEEDVTAVTEYISESIGLYPAAYLEAFVAAAKPLLKKGK